MLKSTKYQDLGCAWKSLRWEDTIPRASANRKQNRRPKSSWNSIGSADRIMCVQIQRNRSFAPIPLIITSTSSSNNRKIGFNTFWLFPIYFSFMSRMLCKQRNAIECNEHWNLLQKLAQRSTHSWEIGLNFKRALEAIKFMECKDEKCWMRNLQNSNE
jgi:hypothetical protein